MIKIIITATLLTLTTFVSVAQEREVTVEETLGFLNNQLKSGVKFTNDYKKGLSLDFDKGAGKYRQDRIFFDEVNNELTKYSDETNSVRIKCHEEESKCIDRQLFEKGIKRQYSGLTIPLKEDANKEEAVRAVQFLIESLIADDILQAKPFGQ